jgi:hypothetical protein
MSKLGKVFQGLSAGLNQGMDIYNTATSMDIRKQQAQAQLEYAENQKKHLQMQMDDAFEKKKAALTVSYIGDLGEFARLSPEEQKAQAPKVFERLNKKAPTIGYNTYDSPDELIADMKVKSLNQSYIHIDEGKNLAVKMASGAKLSEQEIQQGAKKFNEAISYAQNFYREEENDVAALQLLQRDFNATVAQYGQRRHQTQLEANRQASLNHRADAKATKGDPLTQKQLEVITGYGNALDSLDRLREYKIGIDTGPLSNVQNIAAHAIGQDDPETSTTRAQMNTLVSDVVRVLSGLAASDQEREFIRTQVPNFTDNDPTWDAKMEAYVERVEQMRNRTLSDLAIANKDVAGFERESLLKNKKKKLIEKDKQSVPAPEGKKSDRVNSTLNKIKW